MNDDARGAEFRAMTDEEQRGVVGGDGEGIHDLMHGISSMAKRMWNAIVVDVAIGSILTGHGTPGNYITVGMLFS